MSYTSKTITIRNLQYHIHEWGDPSLPTIMALHGWMDCGATFESIATHLKNDFHIIAPDMRGCGDTDHVPTGYWYPDFIADIDALLDHYQLDDNVNLLGHSKGGILSLMYAGIANERIAKVMSLDGLTFRQKHSAKTVDNYRQWLKEIKTPDYHKTYNNLAHLELSIQRNNPSLNEQMVNHLATIWSKPFPQNGKDAIEIKHDTRNLDTITMRHQPEEFKVIWTEVEAEVGLVMAEHSPLFKFYKRNGEIEEALKILNIKSDHYSIVANSAHMLHIEQAADTAMCIKNFFV